MKSIRSRLIAGLSLIVIFFVVQAGLVWLGQDGARRDVVDTARKNTQASSELNELAVLAQQTRRYEKEYFVYVSNEERRNNYIKEWSGASDKMTKLIQAMRANAGGAFTADDTGKMGNWASATEFYSTEMRKIFASVNDQSAKIAAQASAPITSTPALAPAKGASAPVPAAATLVMFSPIEVNAMIGPGKDRLSGVLIKEVGAMSAEKTKQTLALSDVASDGFKQMLSAVLLTVVLGIAIAVVLMLTLPATVTKPLAALTAAVDDMSKGNLEKKVSAAGVAEFDGLAKALERMRVGQQALVQRMRSR